MSKRLVACLTICLFAATAAHAQYGGGSGGGERGERGHGGRGGRAKTSTDTTAPRTGAASTAGPTPLSKIEIVGVILAIDPATDRITIAYEPVQALGWPAGKMPFEVGKTALLKVATVGEKVRFSIESQQIMALRPY